MKTKIQITASDYRALSDEELLRRCNELNEHVAVNYLFERYGHIVFGICLKYAENPASARKIMENIFIKMVTDFRPSATAFKPWLHKYVHDHCLKSAYAATGKNTVSYKAEHDKELTNEQMKIEDIESAIGTLTADERQCIELFYLKNKNYAEVSIATGFPVPQVKELLYAGKYNIEHNIGRAN